MDKFVRDGILRRFLNSWRGRRGKIAGLAIGVLLCVLVVVLLCDRRYSLAALLPEVEIQQVQAELYWQGAGAGPKVNLPPQVFLDALSAGQVRRGKPMGSRPSPCFLVTLETEDTWIELLLGQNGAISLWNVLSEDTETRTYWQDTSGQLYEALLDCFLDYGDSPREAFAAQLQGQMALDSMDILCRAQEPDVTTVIWPETLEEGFFAEVTGITTAGETVDLLADQPVSAGGQCRIRQLEQYSSVTLDCGYTCNGTVVARRRVDLKTGEELDAP